MWLCAWLVFGIFAVDLSIQGELAADLAGKCSKLTSCVFVVAMCGKECSIISKKCFIENLPVIAAPCAIFFHFFL
jgi:hypothetical protein